MSLARDIDTISGVAVRAMAGAATGAPCQLRVTWDPEAMRVLVAMLPDDPASSALIWRLTPQQAGQLVVDMLAALEQAAWQGVRESAS